MARPMSATRAALRLSALSLILGLNSCSDSSGPIDCSQPLTLRVSGGANPIVSWTPACAVSAVHVLYVEPGLGEWWGIVTTDLDNRLLPAVALGKPRSGTTMIGPRSQIVAGTFFQVQLG